MTIGDFIEKRIFDRYPALRETVRLKRINFVLMAIQSPRNVHPDYHVVVLVLASAQ